MEMNPQAELALKFLQTTGTNIFLTGKAGTGKTTFLKNFRKISFKRMIIVAPTGVAAINAEGVTIHSFFQLPLSPYLPGMENRTSNLNHKFSREKINIIRSLDLLVIDEISMVRADLLDAVSDVLCRYRNSTLPFGGVQLLLIGDMQQLAPVVKEEEWNLLKIHYPSVFFFDSFALAKSNYLCIELTHVYRQEDDTFIHLLNNIRDGIFDSATLDALNRRYIPGFRPKEDEGYITLTTHNYMAQQTNTERLNDLPGKTYTYNAEIKEDYPSYAYPTDEQLELKLGAQVMFIKNDTSGERRYYNGKIGKVTFISSKKITVTDPQGNEIPVERETWENVKYTIDPQSQEIKQVVTGTFTQYPLKTAWAITIHKSQGLTFERAIIDAASAFSHGQVYVALSRCKTLEGIVLNSRLTPNALIKEERLASFSENLYLRTPDEKQLFKAQEDYYVAQLSELFDFHPLQNLLQHLTMVVHTQLRTLYPKLVERLLQTRNDFRTDMTEIGERFQRQLAQMIAESPNYIEDEAIQERVCKGTQYFLDKIKNRFMPDFKKLYMTDIDNKDTRKQITNALAVFMDELRVKNIVLEDSNDGFELLSYLSCKAKAGLNRLEYKEYKEYKEDTTTVTESPSSNIRHPELYEKIRLWRLQLANQKNTQAYKILQQKALIGISNDLPTTEQELKAVFGVGKKTIELYGQTLLEMVAEYRLDHPEISNAHPITETEPAQAVENDPMPETEPIQTTGNDPMPETEPIQTAGNDPMPETEPIQTADNDPMPDIELEKEKHHKRKKLSFFQRLWKLITG